MGPLPLPRPMLIRCPRPTRTLPPHNLPHRRCIHLCYIRHWEMLLLLLLLTDCTPSGGTNKFPTCILHPFLNIVLDPSRPQRLISISNNNIHIFRPFRPQVGRCHIRLLLILPWRPLLRVQVLGPVLEHVLQEVGYMQIRDISPRSVGHHHHQQQQFFMISHRRRRSRPPESRITPCGMSFPSDLAKRIASISPSICALSVIIALKYFPPRIMTFALIQMPEALFKVRSV